MTAPQPSVAAPGAQADVLPIHPFTGLRALGIVGGRPVWPILGGSGEGEGGQGDGGQAPTGTQQPQQNPATTQQPGPGAQQQPVVGQDLASQPDWVQKLVGDLRTENASHRTAKQTAAQEAQAAKTQRDAILKAVGFNPDGTDLPPDPAALAAQIEQAQAVAWTSAVELNVYKAAVANGLDPAALTDSRAFIDSLDAFTEDDISTPEFGTKLAAHIKAYGEKHPQFKANQQSTAPPRAGTDRAGGSGGAPTRQPAKGLGAAIRAHYTGQSG